MTAPAPFHITFYKNVWCAVIPNAVYIPFADGLKSVQALGQALQAGHDAVIHALSNKSIFVTSFSADALCLMLLKERNCIYMDGKLIYEALYQGVRYLLWDYIVEAGKAILAFFKSFSVAGLVGDGAYSLSASWGENEGALSAKSAPPDFSLTVSNFTDQKFTLVESNLSIAKGTGSIVSQPVTGYVLGAGNSQTMSWLQYFTSIWQTESDGWLIWKTSSGVRFGIRIHVPTQVAGIGTAPYYQVLVGDGGWFKPNNTPANPYTFDANIIGANVYVDPTAGSFNLSIQVNITDKPSL